MTTPSASLRWGCVGTGNISLAMAQQLSRIPGMTKEAICSASGQPAAAAEAKRAEFGYARALTLDELVADPCVDVVYVASANNAHASHCLRALRAGKPVLCEKPLTMSAADAEELFREASERGVLLVEGTFSAYLPAFDLLRKRLPDIGAIQRVELNKKIRMKILESSPIVNKRELGGGLFEGCGSYTFHALCAIFGASAVAALQAEDVDVCSNADPSGSVDWDTTVTLRISGTVAVLTHRATNEARRSVIVGEKGVIEFTLPRLEEVHVNGQAHPTAYGVGGPFQDLPEDAEGGKTGLHAGLGMEALVVRDALAAGLTGPGIPDLPVDTMRAMAKAMDLVRQQIPTHLSFSAEGRACL